MMLSKGQKNFLYKIRIPEQYQIWFLAENFYMPSKMKDAFESRLLVYGNTTSNPEIASVPIVSHFSRLWRS
jgi:hypothetical protein